MTAADQDFSLSAIQRKRSSAPPAAAPSASSSTSAPSSSSSSPSSPAPTPASSGFSLPFDPLLAVDALVRRSPWILTAAALAGATLATLGWQRFNTRHVATAQIIQAAPSSPLRHSESGEPYQPHQLAIPTLTALMRGAAIIEKTSARLESKVPSGLVKAGLIITPERNTDIVRVTYNSDSSSDQAVSVLRAYIEEVLAMTRDIQQRDAAEMSKLLALQISRAEEELLRVNDELLAYARREELIDADKQIDAYLSELGNLGLKFETTRLDHETIDLRIQAIENELSKVSPAAAKLQQASEELAQLRLRYTDQHPTIMEASDRVEALRASLADDAPRLDTPPRPGESTVAESLYMELVRYRSEKQVLGEQLDKLAALRTTLNAKLELLPRKALEYARIKSRQQDLHTSRTLLAARQREAAIHAENAQGSFRLLALDRPQDVAIERPTRKILMAGLGGFAATAAALSCLIGAIAVADRRVRTPADLKRSTRLPVLGALGPKTKIEPDQWAFRTWTRLQSRLATPGTHGATLCGFLTDSMEHGARLPALLATAASSRGHAVILVSHGPSPATAISAPLSQSVRLCEGVVAQLAAAPHQIVHLTLDDQWTWTHSQRQDWLRALARWSQLRGTVILVQLAAPAEPDTLLTAERIPNLLWIGRGCATTTDAIHSQIETYRAAGCRLVAALLDDAHPFRLPILNQLAPATAALFLALASQVSAATPPAAPLPLGPGDAVNISVPGRPEYARNAVTIGPDGRLTYLQAQNLPAAGLTIDQLRSRLMTELRQFHKNLIVVVTPMTFQSRKVYVLGKIVKKGALNLERPLTILEAVAESGGLETGLFQQNTVELADLGRSFLMRGNARVPVNMEALFFKGDMSQNALLQPGDYLYFPSANSNEIYVLGNVKMQGTQGLLAHTSVHSAIAQAGGFTPSAYTQRILVVRGALDKPETFTVNLAATLAGREKGFKLEPKDIVFIADKPWARAEELLSFALNAFTQGAISSWISTNPTPFIQDALLPPLR
jgi:protein involved in polysaccharide export with SLBB domain/capsular polysaccharide biosynthesis protein